MGKLSLCEERKDHGVRPNTKEHLKPDLVPVQEIVPEWLNGELQKLSLCEEPKDHDVRPNTKEHLKPDLVPVQEIVHEWLNGELQKLSLCEEPQDHDGRVTRRRSSILGSNTGEVDISFPPAARRSLTG